MINISQNFLIRGDTMASPTEILYLTLFLTIISLDIMSKLMKVWCLGKIQGQKEGSLSLNNREFPTILTFGTHTSFSGWPFSSATSSSTTFDISKRYSMQFHWLEVWYPSSWSPSFGSTTMHLRILKWPLWKNFIVIKRPRNMELAISSRN